MMGLLKALRHVEVDESMPFVFHCVPHPLVKPGRTQVYKNVPKNLCLSKYIYRSPFVLTMEIKSWRAINVIKIILD